MTGRAKRPDAERTGPNRRQSKERESADQEVRGEDFMEQMKRSVNTAYDLIRDQMGEGLGRFGFAPDRFSWAQAEDAANVMARMSVKMAKDFASALGGMGESSAGRNGPAASASGPSVAVRIQCDDSRAVQVELEPLAALVGELAARPVLNADGVVPSLKVAFRSSAPGQEGVLSVTVPASQPSGSFQALLVDTANKVRAVVSIAIAAPAH